MISLFEENYQKKETRAESRSTLLKTAKTKIKDAVLYLIGAILGLFIWLVIGFVIATMFRLVWLIWQ